MSNCNLAYQNFLWRIQAVTPDTSISTKRFAPVSQSRDATRAFSLELLEAQPIEPSNLHSISLRATYALVVSYASERIQAEKLDAIMSADQASLIAALFSPDTYRGYDGSHTTNDTGLRSRVLVGSKKVKDGEQSSLSQEWECIILESLQ